MAGFKEGFADEQKRGEGGKEPLSKRKQKSKKSEVIGEEKMPKEAR